MARLNIKNCNSILEKKLEKYQPENDPEKLIKMKILQTTKYYLLIKVELQNKVS